STITRPEARAMLRISVWRLDSPAMRPTSDQDIRAMVRRLRGRVNGLDRPRHCLAAEDRNTVTVMRNNGHRSKRVLDKTAHDCKTARIPEQQNSGTTEETMNINRRELALPALAIGLLGVVPAFAASADEEAVAKNVEAFRLAQIKADAEALDALCAAELSYSHSSGKVEDKPTFIANATDGKSKFLSL